MKLPLFIENILQKFDKSQQTKPMTAKEKWMLFLLAGLLLAVIFFPTEKVEQDFMKSVDGILEDEENDSEVTYNSAGMSLSQYEMYLSEKLEDIISELDGAGEVQAWVTVSGSSEKVFFQESDSEITSLQEADSVGGSRTEETNNINEAVITDRNGDPYVIKTLQPEVEGVLVVAEGAGNSVVKKNISEAVEVLFGIDAHRIKVAKKKVEE